jgi:hypothetical protein
MGRLTGQDIAKCSRARVTAEPSRESDQMNWLGKLFTKTSKAAFDLPVPLRRVAGQHRL